METAILRAYILENFPESDMHDLLVALAIPLVISASSGFFSVRGVLWFMSLLQSNFTPPRKTFRIMWSISYILMGFASFFVWREQRDILSEALVVYAVQLFFNSLWCPFFFGLKRLDLALLNITILNICLIYCIYLFVQVSFLAAVLMLPYLAWVIFSTTLNADFLRLDLGKKRNPTFYTSKYSCHTLYQTTLEAQMAKEGNSFYSSIPNAPQQLSTPPPLVPADSPKSPGKLGPGAMRFRFNTPESMYVQ